MIGPVSPERMWGEAGENQRMREMKRSKGNRKLRRPQTVTKRRVVTVIKKERRGKANTVVCLLAILP